MIKTNDVSFYFVLALISFVACNQLHGTETFLRSVLS